MYLGGGEPLRMGPILITFVGKSFSPIFFSLFGVECSLSLVVFLGALKSFMKNDDVLGQLERYGGIYSQGKLLHCRFSLDLLLLTYLQIEIVSFFHVKYCNF